MRKPGLAAWCTDLCHSGIKHWTIACLSNNSIAIANLLFEVDICHQLYTISNLYRTGAFGSVVQHVLDSPIPGPAHVVDARVDDKPDGPQQVVRVVPEPVGEQIYFSNSQSETLDKMEFWDFFFSSLKLSFELFVVLSNVKKQLSKLLVAERCQTLF